MCSSDLQDRRWSALESAARREATAFGIIAQATRSGISSTAAEHNYLVAMNVGKVVRPLFLAQCLKADPARFQPVPSASPQVTHSTPASSRAAHH